MINPVHKDATGAAAVNDVHNGKGASAKSVEGSPSIAHQAASSAAISQVEKVALSEKAKFAQAVAAAARNSSGVNELRVSAIRQAITNGEYQVSPSAIAEAIAKLSWMLGAK